MRYGNHRSGFTIIEISIVLIIIGLIVSGVLVGRNLIKAAELRATISQIEQYNITVNTFRTKYNGIPGDLRTADAVAFGMETRTSMGTGVINDNKLLESTTDNITNQSTTVLGNETSLFWRDLTFSGLIKQSFVLPDDDLVAGVGVLQLGQYLPSTKIGHYGFITVYSSNGTNYFQLGSYTSIFLGGFYRLRVALTPQEAFGIDSKIDDGVPLTGIARGNVGTGFVLGVACNPAAAAGNGDACCGNNAGGSTNIYKTVTDQLANTPACHISTRFN